MRAFLRSFTPFFVWLKGYSPADLKADALAGLSVALVLVPQSMANAQLAGLPAWHGLYAALLPAAAGGLWGSSRQMVTGSVAVISLMAAAALQPLAISGPAGYVAHMALLTLLVGGVQLALGLCRLGIVVNFLSLPVISGFTNAVAIIIAASQLPKLFGVTVNASGSQYRTTLDVLQSAWNYTHLPSIAMAALAAAVIWGISRFAPRVPPVLAAVCLTTALSWLCGFENAATTDLDRIASPEAKNLIERLNRQDAELANISDELARLRTLRPATPAEELETAYKTDGQRLLREHVEQRRDLVREHLRRMLFSAARDSGGNLVFYARHSPGLAPGTVLNKNMHEAAGMPARDFMDGRTWRLFVGNGPLDPAALRLTSGGAVVGAMPSGLPSFSLPPFSWASLLALLPQALIIAFVGFADSISIAKAAANKLGHRLDANQELVGQGLANISGGLTLSAPVAGSFSVSAVNMNAGARTGLSSVFAAAGALAALLFLTGALRYLPQPVLAVIVMRAVGGLVNLNEFRRLWTAQWGDGCIAVITFAATLFFAPRLDYGIALGVLLSLGAFFYRSMHPRIVALSCGPDNTLRDATAFNLEECRHIAIIHFQGALFFASAATLEEHVLWRLENQKELRHIHLVCTGITHIDASGEESLAMLVDRAHKAGLSISFSGVVGSVAEVLERTGVIESVGWENLFLTPREAVCAIHKSIRHDADCEECPLTDIFCRKRELEESYQKTKPL